MGRKKSNHGKHWTEQDIEYLSRVFLSSQLSTMSKRLKRTENAILRKLDGEFGTRKKTLLEGLLTTTELADILGVTVATVSKYVTHYGLPATKNYKRIEEGSAEKVLNAYTYLINPDDVWPWLEKNRNKMKQYASVIKRGHIVPEPQWLIDDIENNVFYGQSPPYSQDESALLLYYRLRTDKTFRECGEILGRSLGSVQKQYKKLMKDSNAKIQKMATHGGILASAKKMESVI